MKYELECNKCNILETKKIDISTRYRTIACELCDNCAEDFDKYCDRVETEFIQPERLSEKTPKGDAIV